MLMVLHHLNDLFIVTNMHVYNRARHPKYIHSYIRYSRLAFNSHLLVLSTRFLLTFIYKRNNMFVLLVFCVAVAKCPHSSILLDVGMSAEHS